ncbi:15526_t:CDS:2, partial [Gigaspora margarita]
GNDISDFLVKLKLYLQNQDVDLANNAGGPLTERELAIGYLRKSNYRPEELHRKFLDAFPLLWLEKAKDIGEHLSLNELTKKLYEIELYQNAKQKKDKISDSLVFV